MHNMANTVRLVRGADEIVFVFSGYAGNVQVSEDGRDVVWSFANASTELVTRVRLGWTVVPVTPGE